MLVGVLSDIHDNLDNLEKALSEFRSYGIETLIFCGDFCSPIPARVLGAFDGTVHCVFGNGDGDRFAIRGFADGDFPGLKLHGEWAELELGGRSVAMTHYPFYAQALARTGDYDAVFSGHTHERQEQRVADTLWVNPGEVLGWKGRPSVVVWDTESDQADFVELVLGP